jgi:hypothetical protein
MAHERTFGARWLVAEPGRTQRDMKRGPIGATDHRHDAKDSQR